MTDSRRRLASCLLEEIDELAGGAGVSRNRLIAAFINEALIQRGCPGVLKMAPDFLAYLDRTKARSKGLCPNRETNSIFALAKGS